MIQAPTNRALDSWSSAFLCHLAGYVTVFERLICEILRPDVAAAKSAAQKLGYSEAARQLFPLKLANSDRCPKIQTSFFLQ